MKRAGEFDWQALEVIVAITSLLLARSVSLCPRTRRGDDEVGAVESQLLNACDEASSHAKLVFIVEIIFDPLETFRAILTTEAHCHSLRTAERRDTATVSRQCVTGRELRITSRGMQHDAVIFPE